MNGFKHRTVLADVRARRKSQSANKARAKVAHDITIKVLSDKYVELLWLRHELHTAVVDKDVVGLNVGILLCDLIKLLEEHSVGKFHDVRFVNDSETLSFLRSDELESVFVESAAARSRDDFDRLSHVGVCLVLNTRIEVFRVFADDNDVDVVFREGSG